MGAFIGTAYSIDPDTVKFDTKLIEFNKEKKPEDYSALRRSIIKDKQSDPIFIKDGLCGNGRHRVRICKELGINVIAIDVDPKISEKAYLELCNKDTFTARNDTPTQLAIKAYNMTKDYGYTDPEAMSTLGITNRNAIAYVRFIDSTRYSSLLDTLASGGKVNIDGAHTKSIDVAKRKIAKILEEEAGLVEVVEIDEVQIDYNSLIETDTGIDWFWIEWNKFERIYNTKMTHETALTFVSFANKLIIKKPL